MDRLTGKNEYGGITVRALPEALEKLAAYEDTGLTPEECKQYATADKEGRYIVLKEPERDGVNRLQEIARADKEMRLIVLPCKVGDYLYAVTKGQVSVFEVNHFEKYHEDLLWIGWHIVEGVIGSFRIDGVPAVEIGKSVFLTREEAEAALEEAES